MDDINCKKPESTVNYGDIDAPDTKHGSSFTSVSAEVVMLLHAAKM